jgi:hypothetical protein
VGVKRATQIGLAGGSGIIGFGIGKLSGADVQSLLSQFQVGFFEFLKQQGAYASFAIVMTVGFGWLSVWCIRLLVQGKQEEIDRVVKERDKFEQLFIDHWQSSRSAESEKGGKKK